MGASEVVMKRIFAFLLLLLLLGGCGINKKNEANTVTGIPVELSKSTEEGIDFEFILEQVEHAVKEHLPEARYHGVVYKGKCENISAGEGELVLHFIQVKSRFFPPHPSVFHATATVNTQLESLDLSIRDDSNYYPNLNVYPKLRNEEFFKILSITDDHIKQYGIVNCDVVITQLEESWGILCDPLNGEERKCQFNIDSKSFEVLKFQSPK